MVTTGVSSVWPRFFDMENPGIRLVEIKESGWKLREEYRKRTMRKRMSRDREKVLEPIDLKSRGWRVRSFNY